MITETQISDINQFIRHVQKVGKSGNEIWYRGVSNKTHSAIPSLFRHPTQKSASAINKLEAELLAEFNFRHHSYVEFHSRDDWDIIFLMQHFKVPTRLLDWTASPLTALFFALDSSEKNKDAAVLVLHPKEWNRGMLEDIGNHDRVFPTSDDFLNQYHPYKREKTARLEPIAIHGMVNNARINAQKGKFLLFG